MKSIGDTFKIQNESKWNDCYVGQEVVIDDIDTGSSYLVSDANDSDYFCCLQSVPFEEVDS